MSYADQDSKSESSGRGSHIFVWEEVKQLIKDKNFSEARKLDQRVKLLRNNRRMADYTTESFGLDEAVECADEAEGIIKN